MLYGSSAVWLQNSQVAICISVNEFVYLRTGCLRKNALLGFLNPWDRLMPVVTIVLVKVVGEMLDGDKMVVDK